MNNVVSQSSPQLSTLLSGSVLRLALPYTVKSDVNALVSARENESVLGLVDYTDIALEMGFSKKKSEEMN
jgi:hypothetical protein